MGKRVADMTDAERASKAEYNREYAKANADRIAAYRAEYVKANAERIAAYQAEYAKANAKRKAEQTAEWRKTNPEYNADYSAEWRKGNPEYDRKQKVEYRKRPGVLAKMNAADARRRASCKAHTPNPATAAERAALTAPGQTCNYCPEPATTVDHYYPIEGWPHAGIPPEVLAKGPDDLSNLVGACRSCNSSKGAKMPNEWRGRLAREVA